MENYLDVFIKELLHVNEANKNKLIDLYAGNPQKTYVLTNSRHPDDLYSYCLELIATHVGKVGNTILRGSALKVEHEQIVARRVNDFEFTSLGGDCSVKALDKFIESCYRELNLKGNNPLFLSIGSLSYKTMVSQGEVRTVESPMLIFPIRLIRSTGTSNVSIEFIDDDKYFNPCLEHKLRSILGDDVIDNFPHPEGVGREVFSKPINLKTLGDGKEYFNKVKEYCYECSRFSEGTVFECNPNRVAIAQYDHDEITVYYDLKRNRELIYAHPLVKRIFTEQNELPPVAELGSADFVLPYDSYQENIIRRVASGESLIIKGPPGTGKTQTIANMISSLLAKGKRVLLASKKLSALGEVNAKLPEELRKFTMLLDFETEEQAARFNPVEIRRDFNEQLKYASSYSFDKSHESNLNGAKHEMVKELKAVSEYVKLNFKTPVNGRGQSLSDVLDGYLARPDVIALDLENKLEIKDMTEDVYRESLSVLEDAQRAFDKLTSGGKNLLYKAPWYYFSKDEKLSLEEVFEAYERIVPLAVKVKDDFCKIAHSFDGVTTRFLTLLDALGLAEVGVSDVTELKGYVQKLLANEELTEELNETLFDLEWYAQTDDTVTVKPNYIKDLDELYPVELNELFDVMSVVQLRNITSNLTFFKEFYEGLKRSKDFTSFDTVKRAFDEIKTIEKRVEEENRNAGIVFENIEANKTKILEIGKPLCKYTNEEKPSFIDFKAKRAVKALTELSYRKNLTFMELTFAVKALNAETEFLEKIDIFKDTINALFRKMLTEEEHKVLAFVFRAHDKVGGVEKLLNALSEAKSLTDKLLAYTEGVDESKAIRQIYIDCLGALSKEKTYRLLNELGLPYFADDFKKTFNVTNALLVLVKLSQRTAFKNVDVFELTKELCAMPTEAKERMRELKKSFGELLDRGFMNNLTGFVGVTLSDLDAFVEQAEDRSLISCIRRYKEIEDLDLGYGKLKEFLDTFKGVSAETSFLIRGSFAEIFERSCYKVALEEAYATMLGADREGFYQNAVSSLNDVEKSVNIILKENSAVIERDLIAKIDVKDPAFSFLNSERASGETLRALFKKHSDGILKLKKCMILSPSTASVLFRPEVYNCFDVVIVDEASQLEPVSVLPVLFRSKQIVIVGDEWQMPPIKHFVTTADKQILSADGEETTVEADISLLTLSLQNRGLRTEALKCHYRSKTESLISYSQRSFYPDMRTFPATLPKKEGLGFRTFHIAEGNSVQGVNDAEASKVVELLEEHFNRYYDVERGTLSESVGVVAFGQKQIERIVELVDKNAVLKKKLNTALYNFHDVKEKLVFFKTIETVQGQETDHLILSLTYGRINGKIVSSFGQLNRGNLGKCIFNVAVTRAKESVSVVHSVLPYEITAPGVKYIAEYLELAMLYEKEGISSFKTTEPSLGFKRTVGEYLISRGVERERIAYDYGVTDGSVRVPIAVLSKDLKEAVLGIWCETELKPSYNYLDYNMRYFSILKESGWDLVRLSAFDYATNPKQKLQLLAELKKRNII